MKIFSIRNMLGLAAIYGAARYAKNNGGARQAFGGLLDKVRDAANMKKDVMIGKAHDASSGSPSAGYSTGSYEGGGYTGDHGGTRRS